jgi:hypothetical protein
MIEGVAFYCQSYRTVDEGFNLENVEIELCQSLSPRDDLNGILSQCYELAVQRMRNMGFDIDLSAPHSALAEFWANVAG